MTTKYYRIQLKKLMPISDFDIKILKRTIFMSKILVEYNIND